MNDMLAEPVRILNVDDDAPARYVKSRILRQAGFVVEEAGDGAQTLAAVRERNPALVLLDVRLPDLSGYEVCRRLKADPATAHVLVLQTSAALISTEDRARGLRGGADHYLAQPFGAEELVASVQALVRLSRAEASMREAVARAEAGARALAEHNARSELLAQATAALLSATEVDAMLGALFERIAAPMELDVYFHYALEDGLLRLASYRGLEAAAAERGAFLTLGQAVCGEVARSGQACAVDDIGRADDAQTAFLRDCGVQAYACTPLLASGRLVGTLGFGRRRARPFVEEELRLLRTLCGSVAVARERILFSQHLEQLAGRLAEADRLKDEFLAMLAHELRNPLAPLTNALALLDRSALLGDPERSLLAMAQRQSARLRRLVEDLLEVSRISRGKIELRREPLALATAVEQAVESVASECRRRGHALTVELPSTPIVLEADPVRLAQVLENLLGNAIKYTPEGGRIRVAANALPDAIEIRVSDDGIGIEPEQLPQMFTMFRQLDATLDRAAGGLGIGLALVKTLVELHGGTVSAASEGLGKGASFAVRLPRATPA